MKRRITFIIDDESNVKIDELSLVGEDYYKVYVAFTGLLMGIIPIPDGIELVSKNAVKDAKKLYFEKQADPTK